MSVLVLDYGTSNITVQCQRGGHAAPRRVGTKPIGFAGGETSSVRAELMVVPVVLQYLTPTTIASIRALFSCGQQVPCRGDVFNNSNATIVCSGILADDFIPSGPWFEGSLTLYEIGTTLGYAGGGGTTPYTLTTGVDGTGTSGGTGTVYVATPGGSPFGACFRVLDSATPATCGSGSCPITYSLTPEKTWVTGALAAGTLSGTPYATFSSKGINGLSGVDIQSTKAILYQVRAGIDVNSWQTGYVPGFFAGGTITMTFPAGLLVTVLLNDRFRIELWGRLALEAGFADSNPYVLARQTICYPGYLYLPGSVIPLP